MAPFYSLLAINTIWWYVPSAKFQVKLSWLQLKVPPNCVNWRSCKKRFQKRMHFSIKMLPHCLLKIEKNATIFSHLSNILLRFFTVQNVYIFLSRSWWSRYFVISHVPLPSDAFHQKLIHNPRERINQKSATREREVKKKGKTRKGRDSY